jgi:hypothetical protein
LLGGNDSLASKVLSNVVDEDEKLELEALSKTRGPKEKLVLDEIRLLVDRVCALANQVDTSSDPLIAQVLSLKGAPSEVKSKRRKIVHNDDNMRRRKRRA